MPRRRPRGSLKGRKRHIKKHRELLVVVDDELTAKGLVLSLRGEWSVPGLRVEHATGSPCAVTKRIQKSISTRRGSGDPPEVWAVFDHDDKSESWARALNMARSLGLNLAVSNPCIEVFGLLLHGPFAKACGAKQAQQHLRAVHHGYDHDTRPIFDIPTVLHHWRDAAARADDRLQTIERDGLTMDNANPFTTFHHLIRRLDELSPPR